MYIIWVQVPSSAPKIGNFLLKIVGFFVFFCFFCREKGSTVAILRNFDKPPIIYTVFSEANRTYYDRKQNVNLRNGKNESRDTHNPENKGAFLLRTAYKSQKKHSDVRCL